MGSIPVGDSHFSLSHARDMLNIPSFLISSPSLRLPCTLKMVNLRFLFFSIKINVSLESFNFEKEI